MSSASGGQVAWKCRATAYYVTNDVFACSRGRRRSTIDLTHNGRRFRSRFCSTAGDQALHARAARLVSIQAPRPTPGKHRNVIYFDPGDSEVRAFAIVLHVEACRAVVAANAKLSVM